MGSSCTTTLSENIRHLSNGAGVENEQATKNRLAKRLLDAARLGDIVEVRAALAEHAPVNVNDEHGWSPLHFSAHGGQVEITRLLLDHQGDANATMHDLSTPLMLAVEEGHIGVARLLLEEGALTKCKDEDGFTAMRRCDMNVKEEFRRLIATLGLEPGG